MNEITIKISKDAYQRIIQQKLTTGASIRFIVDKAIDLYLGKEKKDDTSKKASNRTK